METVTVKGKVYQIGGLYLNAAEEPCTLLRRYKTVFEIEINGMYYDTDELNVIPAVGTITDAPIELEDGEWYMCEYSISGHIVTGMLLCYDGVDFKSSERMPRVNSAKPLHKMVNA